MGKVPQEVLPEPNTAGSLSVSFPFVLWKDGAQGHPPPSQFSPRSPADTFVRLANTLARWQFSRCSKAPSEKRSETVTSQSHTWSPTQCRGVGGIFSDPVLRHSIPQVRICEYEGPAATLSALGSSGAQETLMEPRTAA